MNERIRELAEQAMGTRKHVPPVWQFYDIELEKFAKLIIEEAAKAHLCDSDGVVGKYSDSDRYYFETLMKKQLGLK